MLYDKLQVKSELYKTMLMYGDKIDAARMLKSIEEDLGMNDEKPSPKISNRIMVFDHTDLSEWNIKHNSIVEVDTRTRDGYIDITLPDVSVVGSGFVVNIMNTHGTKNVYIDPVNNNKVGNNISSYGLKPEDTVMLMSDGKNTWLIMN